MTKTGSVYRVVIRPNRSLTRRGMWWLALACTVAAVGVGVGFAAVGAWMILPFMGLEIGALGLVLCWMARHAGDCELVLIDSEHVRIVRRSGTIRERYEFQRYWARVSLERARHRWYPARLWLGSHGRRIELGAGIDEERRAALVAELKQAMTVRTNERERENQEE